ncbi:unnamed protein product [Urochloa humidicola]
MAMTRQPGLGQLARFSTDGLQFRSLVTNGRVVLGRLHACVQVEFHFKNMPTLSKRGTRTWAGISLRIGHYHVSLLDTAPTQ